MQPAPIPLLPGVQIAEAVHVTVATSGVLLTFQVQHPGSGELVAVGQVKMAVEVAARLRSVLNQAWAAMATMEETPEAKENIVPLHRP